MVNRLWVSGSLDSESEGHGSNGSVVNRLNGSVNNRSNGLIVNRS